MLLLSFHPYLKMEQSDIPNPLSHAFSLTTILKDFYILQERSSSHLIASLQLSSLN